MGNKRGGRPGKVENSGFGNAVLLWLREGRSDRDIAKLLTKLTGEKCSHMAVQRFRERHPDLTSEDSFIVRETKIAARHVKADDAEGLADFFIGAAKKGAMGLLEVARDPTTEKVTKVDAYAEVLRLSAFMLDISLFLDQQAQVRELEMRQTKADNAAD